MLLYVINTNKNFKKFYDPDSRPDNYRDHGNDISSKTLSVTGRKEFY